MYVLIREHQVSLLQDGHQMICWALLDIKTEDSNRASPWCSYKWTLGGLRGLTWLPYCSWVLAIVKAFLWHRWSLEAPHIVSTPSRVPSRCFPEPTFPLSFLIPLLHSLHEINHWSPHCRPSSRDLRFSISKARLDHIDILLRQIRGIVNWMVKLSLRKKIPQTAESLYQVCFVTEEAQNYEEWLHLYKSKTIGVNKECPCA